MTLAFMAPYKVPCGISTYSQFLIEGLKANNYNDIYMLAEKVEVLNQKEIEPIVEVQYNRCWARGTYFNIPEKNLNTIHIQHQFGLYPSTTFLDSSLRLCKMNSSKVVLTLHDVIPRTPEMVSYFNAINKYCDDVIVHTQGCYDLFNKDWKGNARVHLIPHGTKIIDAPDKNIARTKLGLPQDKTIILSWGFIWESKGIDHMIEALAIIKKDIPNAMYIHAGGIHPLFNRPDYLRRCYQRAMKLGLTPRDLIIVGEYVSEEDVPYYFGASDIIVLPYMRGSLSASGAAHRVCSAHRPIVAYDDPCLEDIPALKVERGNWPRFGETIVALLKDELQKKSIADRIFRYALSTSWEEIAKEHIKIYG